MPQKINITLDEKINQIKKELSEAEKIKNDSKNLLSEYEKRISKSKKESKEIIEKAKKDNEKIILEKTKKFHELMEVKKKNTEEKILQIKENALKEIKNLSIELSIDAVEELIKNTVDKNKLENIYNKSLDQVKTSLKHTKV